MKREYKCIFIFDNGKETVKRTLNIRSSENPEDIARRADKAAITLRDMAYPGYEVYVTYGGVVNLKIRKAK